MMFVVILLVNLLVAMFATTYSKVIDAASKIWKRQRLSYYQYVMTWLIHPNKSTLKFLSPKFLNPKFLTLNF